MLHEREQRFFYCPKCGGRLNYCYIQSQPRLVCDSCNYIFYENPVVGVAAIVFNEKKQILLGRRRNGKYAGYWCIPCGYVEYDEDVYQAVKREFKEETNLDIDVINVYTVQSNFHDPENHTVGIWFFAQVTNGEPVAGDDLDEVGYFNLTDVPELAFPTDNLVINKLKSEMFSKRLQVLT